MILHEYRSQFRSLRFRVISLIYLAANSAPLLILRANREKLEFHFCSGGFAGITQITISLTTVIIAFLVSAEVLAREREEGSLSVLGIAPVSNTSYVLLRLCGVVSVLIPLSFLPVLINMGIALSSGIGKLEPALFFIPWLFKVCPLMLAGSLAGVGLGTLTGGVVSSALTGLFLFLFGGSLVGYALGLFGRTLPDPDYAIRDLFNLGPVVGEIMDENSSYLGEISDAPLDPRVYATDVLPLLAPWLGGGVFLFSLAVPFLRRTKPDVRVWTVPETHPLRSYVKAINRFREHFSPEPALAGVDKVVLVAGILCAFSGTALVLLKDAEARALAFERLRVEKSGEPAPTSTVVVPVSYRIEGEVKTDGAARFETRFKIKNTGKKEEKAASFVLNEFYSIQSIRVDGKETPFQRALNRLSVEFTEPLPAGASREVDFQYEGRPMEARFPLPEEDMNGNPISFARSIASIETGRDVVSFATTEFRRQVTARRVFLADSDLVPVLRYTTWKPDSSGFMPEERYKFPFQYSMDIRAPGGFLLVDSGGALSEQHDGSRLQTQLRAPTWRVALIGAPVVLTQPPMNVAAMAVLPAHTRFVKKAFERFADAEKAGDGILIPGENPFHEMVIVDWPVRMQLSVFPSWDELQGFFDAQSEGKVCLVNERVFRARSFSSEFLAVPILQDYFLSRRLLDPSQLDFFRNWFFWYFFRRIRPDRTWSCVISNDNIEAFSHDTLFKAGNRWGDRIKSRYVLSSLMNQTGGNALLQGMQKFLLSDSGEPGTAKEMFREIGEAAGEDLSTFYTEYVEGTALPKLELGPSKVSQTADGWEIEAIVKNEGTGHVRCPLEIQTTAGAVETMAEVGPKQEVTVKIPVKDRPRALLLDPTEKVYRAQPFGLKVRVEWQME